MMNKRMMIILSITFILLFISTSFAISREALEADRSLYDANLTLNEMMAAGMNVQRILDLLTEAQQIYAVQLDIETKNGSADYSNVLKRTSEIQNLKALSFRLKDEFFILESKINETIETENADRSYYQPAIELLNQAKEEFSNERYEKSEDLINQAYDELLNLQSATAKAAALYAAASRTIENFLKNNWMYIAAATMIIILIAYFMGNRIRRALIKRKIHRAKMRKKVIEKLIEKTQRNYFEKKTMAEGEYRIKTKEYADMIRDIDRQIPLLMKELKEHGEK